MKHIDRFLVANPRLMYEYRFQEHCDLDTYVDSDYAGDFVSRKSTSGGCVMRGTHLIKRWSNNQSVIALSSGGAELYGVISGASHTIGLQGIAADFSVEVEKTIHTDSSAAKGICERKGVGTIRYLAVSSLLIQDRIRSGDIALRKIAGTLNPADVLTEHVGGHRVRQRLSTMRARPGSDRAKAAPLVGGDNI